MKVPRQTALPLLLGLAAFLLYILTGSRSIQWQDSGQFTLRIGLGRLHNDWGLAMVHPLHYMLGRLAIFLFPGNIPWAVTGVSALGGGLSVGLAAACAQRLTRNPAATLFAGMTLMLAHTFWRFSGLPEVYTLSAALLMLQILLWLRLRERGDARIWILLFAANGLGWANHNLALLELAALGLLFLRDLWRKRIPLPVLIAAAAAWLAGSFPYTVLIALNVADRGELWPVLRSALFGHDFADRVLNLNPFSVYLGVTALFTLLSFPSLALPFACLGARRSARGLSLPLALLGLHLLFVLRYNVIDQYTFLLPSMAVIAWLAGLGYAAVPSPRLRRLAWTLLLVQPLLYAAAPALARRTPVFQGRFARHKPYRDDAAYLLHPWTHRERSAARLAENAVTAATPGSLLVVEDTMALYAIEWELHRQKKERSVELSRPADTERMIQALAEGGRVVWVPARAGGAPEGWIREGEVWTNRIFPAIEREAP